MRSIKWFWLAELASDSSYKGCGDLRDGSPRFQRAGVDLTREYGRRV